MSESQSEAEPNVSDTVGSRTADTRGMGASVGGSASSDSGGESAFLWKMGRMWVEENQNRVMLGAFALGVVVGSLFRE